MSRAEDVGQILPCAIDVGPRASNVTGERFGSLRAEYPCEKTRLGIRWVCRCDCGRYAIRTLARLNVTRRKGQASACSECLAAREAEAKRTSGRNRREYWLKRWNTYGSLWHPNER
jgi:hypothetical protein